MNEKQLKLPKNNPLHVNSKNDCNHVLYWSTQKNWEVKIDPRCRGLIRDLRSVQWDDLANQIKKRNRNEESQRADLLDTWRYKVNVYWRKYIV